ncbi:MAG: hypothetical protein M3070_07690 [Actinomycetota bacterium]|nr:hypothetical protein [Actinomycetota bacterium]
MAFAVQLCRDPSTAERFATVLEHPAHVHRQLASPGRGGGLDLVAPGVVTRPAVLR